MSRYAIINDKGQVVNVIEWDGASPWQPPAFHYTVESEICDNGDSYEPISECFTKICNGKKYHKSCKHQDYIVGQGHIE